MRRGRQGAPQGRGARGAAGHSWRGGGRSWRGGGRSWAQLGAPRGRAPLGDAAQQGGGAMAQRSGASGAGGAQLGHSWGRGTARVAVAQLAAAGHLGPMQVMVLAAADPHLERIGVAAELAVRPRRQHACTAGTAHIWRRTHLQGHRARVTCAGSPPPRQRLWAGVCVPCAPQVV